MQDSRLPVFQSFVSQLRALWAREPDMQRRMEGSLPLLRDLVSNDEMQRESAEWPSTEGRKNLLFYVDPDYGFAINGVVRIPGRRGSVHDHASAWVAYGVLTGTESLERYKRVDDGSRAGFAQIELTSVTEGASGRVDLVPPWDIHAEQGGTTRSTAIILRSERLGDIPQNTFDPETGKMSAGPGPTQIPYGLACQGNS
jgi:predicted metal-dependent enzyme (double-stranded beta helix superfamily)